MNNLCGVILYLPRSFVFRQKTSGNADICAVSVTRFYMNGYGGFSKLVFYFFL